LSAAAPIAALDAAYADSRGAAACVLFAAWDAETPTSTIAKAWPAPPAPYESGAFFKRELPALLAVASGLPPLSAIVIDGYVWLDADNTPGLGGRLYQALGSTTPVIGVAKTMLRGDDWSAQVMRGASARPLYVTAAGVDLADAAAAVKRMHGRYRVPTLLRLADQAARAALSAA
jgi:deoxyribonuclease V